MDSSKQLQWQLEDPRPRVVRKAVVSALMKLSIVFRVVVFTLSQFSLLNVEWINVLLWAITAEMIVTSAVFLKYARWEDQEHWVTFWQATYVFEVISLRHAFYDNALLLLITFTGLYLTYFIGIYTEFTKNEEARLPPFVLKKNDVHRPNYGWLGKSICRFPLFKFKAARMLITLVLYLASVFMGYFAMYAMFFSQVDDLRNLTTYKADPDLKHAALTPLLLVAILASSVAMIPTLMVEGIAIPGLWTDLLTMKKASRSYRTKVWDVCELDEDKSPDSDLKKKLQDAGKVLDFTIVLPCFLPNEEEVLPHVFQHYLHEFDELKAVERELKLKTESKKVIMVVWNSPKKHPEFQTVVDEWSSKYASEGFSLVVYENTNSTSKCDNLNFACGCSSGSSLKITTDMCCLNDADTMVDWSCIIRGSLHIDVNKVDIAQAMNSHCKYDCMGTPGDDDERQCHPYGILIAVGDSTKPQNMSTQTFFKHAPFNGRGGFWKTSSLAQVGFDHRTVGEDHDAGYRACAYFGMKGVLDMNMLCQEQEPPNCVALTSQRIRWETAALEMRRTFSWIIRSPFYSKTEVIVLLWGQLSQNCNLPFQALPYQVVTVLPLVIIKGWLSVYGFTADLTPNFCQNNTNCAYELGPVTNPVTGSQVNVVMPLALLIFAGLGIFFLLVNLFDFIIRICTTRYRPRIMYLIYYGLLKGLCVQPYFVYLQYWSLYDYCWGGAKFIPTARSPISPKNRDEPLTKPLLQ
jgi:hypothetical protein